MSVTWPRPLLVLWLVLCAVWLFGCADTEGFKLASLTTPEPDVVRVRAQRRLDLATAYFSQGQHQVAQQEVRAALQIDPQYAEAYSLLGLIHQSDNAPALAQQSFEHALLLAQGAREQAATLAAVQHNHGWFLCQQRDFSQAQAQFERALSHPSYRQVAKTQLAQSVCHWRAGQLPQAQTTVAVLNASEQANADSLWLGIRLAHLTAQTDLQQQLSQQLQQRFPSSAQAQALAQQRFDEP